MENTENQLIEMPTHQQLMSDAKNTLSGQWGIAVPAFLIYMIILSVGGIIPFASLIIAGPFALGLSIFALNFSRGRTPEISNIFDGFNNFGNALAVYVLMMLAVSLGLLLLIVPGIIIAFGLSQVMFILADEPKINPVDALKKSWEMMKGHKMDYFILSIRFIPWALLCILTLGIGFFWLGPYIHVTYANFYDALKGTYGLDGGLEDDITQHLVE